ncbi:MAG: GNAT family N-acetyltransferase [Geminicoccaceae bacterium]
MTTVADGAMTARLRRARPADAAAVAALHLAARRDAMPYLPALRSDEQIRAWTRDTLLPKAEVWVAELAGRPVGYLALVDDILDHLYVGPEHQNRGVGSLLLAKAKALRPGGLRLYAFQRNRHARAFYEARGFAPVEFSDGASNDEQEPDVLYEWHGARSVMEA